MQINMYMKTKLRSEFSLVIGRWKSDKQARHVRGAVVTVLANTYFLV